MSQAKPTIFRVEPTQYGWIVRDGATQLGLFVSQQQALADVKKRRQILKQQGRPSSVEVAVEFPDGSNSRSIRSPWSAGRAR